jgi:hypothetical protein
MRLGGVAERLARRVTPRKSEKIIVSHCVSTDLLRQHLETPAGDPAPKLLKPGAHALYGLGPLREREGSPFFAVDNKDRNPGLLRCNLLDQGLWVI